MIIVNPLKVKKLSESLEETKKQIMNFITSNRFNLFLGFTRIQNEVIWNSKQKTWKDLLEIAKNENIKTLIYYDSIFLEELEDVISEIKKIQENMDEDFGQLNEIKLQLKSYETYSEKLSFIQLGWVKEGICYSYQLLAPWYEKFIELKDQIHEILKEKAKTGSLEEEKRTLIATKKKLKKLSEEIAEWAKPEGLKKVTRPQLQAYLLENEIFLTWENKLSLITIINRKLEQ